MVDVSVALCTYNGAAFVGEQLDSILAQTRRPAEIVVSDDASGDTTVAVVRAALAGFSEASVLENAHPLGVVGNFQQAVTAAHGELIALSDQDDRWLPEKLERMSARFAADPSLLFLHTDARLIDDRGAPTGTTLFQSLEVSAADRDAVHAGEAFAVYLRRNLATGATVVFRRSLLEAALPFPAEWVHDEWLAIIAAALSGADLMEECLTDYRRHDANQIGVADPTLRGKVGRVLQPRGDRNRGLARRAEVLVQRLETLGDRIPAGTLELARRKLTFEATRAAMPALRVGRLAAVARLATRGDYERFASRGRADIVRDVLQPA
ncbi:glycosyltransferase family 2 protein [Leifsonia sp. LS-T14]|uniref:glycosyltransferase family 2 protein n=1 Tax=unclassified Leifsonia TaxID=2663824 RepID=UPI0035A6BDB5